ncbi:MAG: site-specific integrase, partial [Kiritimatiellae bacterium]|nr:site-specific integrase [Kiritimatiellia bacterium]
MKQTHSTRAAGHLELKKTGYWYIVVRTRDEFRAINTETKSREEAEGKLEAFLADVRRRKEEACAAIPLAKVWDQYERSPNAYRHDEATRRKKRSAWLYVAEWMRDNHPEADEASKITVSIANEYMNHYRKSNTTGTCNNKLKFFTGMFDALRRDGIVDGNPWLAVRRFPKDSHTRRELTAGEVGRILSEAAARGGEWHSLMAVGLYTGLRLGDCCMLDWKDLDLAHTIMQVIPRKTRKYACGHPVTIPIHPQLLGMLERTPPDARRGLVLGEMAELYQNHRSTLTTRIKEIFTAAGIETSVMIEGRTRPTPYATFHSLRHSFVSFATNSGVPLPVVQSIVGHHSSAMTRHYYHANEEALRKAVDAVPDFEEAGSPAAPPAVKRGRGRPRRIAQMSAPPQ